MVPKHPSETPARGVDAMVRNAVRGMVDSCAKRAIYRAERVFRRAKCALALLAGRSTRPPYGPLRGRAAVDAADVGSYLKRAERRSGR